ncbi:MFS transporter [Ruixingdingia sedimenti]|uniref:MFS transporter n=1 Tax=Ruixingdingia sedimenti TaxID=3073604 RepID=A0ABU1F3Y5_9RHOB|nr:MFS transporter [Xinfangfangia sp. LG-4]MDR5651343.1 MFS transporter [Xinfangfangia sp. LG-4]
MIRVVASSWALLLGVLLLMVGNGMQGTLLGLRGGIEGFTTAQMSVVMACYSVGFLGGSQLAPEMIRHVGHVRVFAALGSLISAVLILFPVFPDWIAWSVMRLLLGFCFSGVYVTAESWLNDSATNETRGRTLSAYMIVQMVGITAAQALLLAGDPSGYLLFVIPSVLVSLAFTPILLSASPAPAFGAVRPMAFRALFRGSPLGCVGMFLTGAAYAGLAGMAAVWGTQVGLSVVQISVFVGAIFVGGMLFQYPIGYASDRMDRRLLILILSAAGVVAVVWPTLHQPAFWPLVVLVLILGGVLNPLYALLIAHANDFLDNADMAGASAGLIFLYGLGAIAGPLVTGWMMDRIGQGGFFAFVGLALLVQAAYAGWRMTRRPAPAVADTGAFAPLAPTASALAVEAVMAPPETRDDRG